MKLWLAILIFILSYQPRAHATAPIDIVFDIDWTTFYSIENSEVPSAKNQTRVVEGQSYRYTDYLPEVIETLLTRHPEVRISFFSGGSRSRNEALLSQVHLADGRSLLQVAHRVFSKEHLQELSQNETLPFATRYKKNLSLVMPEAIPSRTILIDDQVEFAVKPNKAVSSLGIFNFTEHFDSTRAGTKYQPNTQEEWQLERNKALLWLSLLSEALSRSQRTGSDFSNEVVNLWRSHSSSTLTVQTGKDLVANPQAPLCSTILF